MKYIKSFEKYSLKEGKHDATPLESGDEWFTMGVTKTPDEGGSFFRQLSVYGYEPRYRKLNKEYSVLEIPMKHKERYKEIGLQHPYNREVRVY